MALLDEITRKKGALDSLRPLPFDVVHTIADWFERELTVAAALVEGCRLNRQEIAQVMQKRAPLRGLPDGEQRLLLNHVKALQLMARLADEPAAPLNERTIAAFHELLFQGIDDRAGRYREGEVPDGAAGLPDPAKLRVSMSALSGWLRRTDASPEAAVEAHVRLMALRPFDRGNAATALLVTNLILNRSGFPPVVVRAEELESYRDTLEHARVVGDKAPFRETMLSLVGQSLDLCLMASARAARDRADA